MHGYQGIEEDILTTFWKVGKKKRFFRTSLKSTRLDLNALIAATCFCAAESVFAGGMISVYTLIFP